MPGDCCQTMVPGDCRQTVVPGDCHQTVDQEYCRVDRVGQVDRVGVGQVDRVGVGLVDHVGQVDRVGKLDPVGVGQVDRVGVVQVYRVWVGQMGCVVVNAFKLIVNVLNERELCWSIDIILQGGDNVQDYYVC